MEEKEKGKLWAFIVYPESAPNGWERILKQSYLPMVISPLHDKDIFEDGENKGKLKKAHYHCLVEYPNTTTFNSILSISKSVNGSNPIVIKSKNGYVKYLDHSEEEDKVKYNYEDIQFLNDFQLMETDDTKVDYSIKILKFINDNMIFEFSEVMEKLPKYDLDLFRYFIKTNAVWDRYITSLRNKKKFSNV